MIGFKTLLVDTFKEGAFPLVLGSRQYADRKTFLCDSAREDVTCRKVTKCRRTQVDYPPGRSLHHGKRVSNTLSELFLRTGSPTTPVFDLPVHHVEEACWVSPSNHPFLMRDSSGDYNLKGGTHHGTCLVAGFGCCLPVYNFTANRENLLKASRSRLTLLIDCSN